MTQDYETGLPSDRSGSTMQTAKDQATGVAHSAAESGAHLAGQARSQAAEVGREAGRQAKDILTQGRTQIADQASQQQHKLAGGIRTFSEELSTMAGASSEPGIASEVARQVSSRVDAVAGWLDSREPADLLDEVKTFARNNPGTFLVLAAGAGLLVGRLTRGLRDGGTTTGESSPAAHRAPGVASTGYGLESGATYGTGSTYGTAAPSTGSTYTESGTYVAGAAYGAGAAAGVAGSTGDTGAYGTGGEPTYGLETETGYGSATPTTQGSSDDTLAFSTSEADPYLGAPDTYGTGTENPPGEAVGYEGDQDDPGIYGGGTTEVPERERGLDADADAAWPPVQGEDEQR